MKENTVKNILIFFLIFLPLQYAIVGVVGLMKSEPWPAFVLPAFKSVYSTDGRIVVDQLRLYAQSDDNGRVLEVDPNLLFKEVKGSQRQGIYRTHFSDSTSIAGFDTQTKAWLKNKINEQHPSLAADQLNIQWVKKVFNLSTTGSAGYTTKKSKQFSISLEGE